MASEVVGLAFAQALLVLPIRLILIEDAAGNKLQTGMLMPLRRAAMDDVSMEVD